MRGREGRRAAHETRNEARCVCVRASEPRAGEKETVVEAHQRQATLGGEALNSPSLLRLWRAPSGLQPCPAATTPAHSLAWASESHTTPSARLP